MKETVIPAEVPVNIGEGERASDYDTTVKH